MANAIGIFVIIIIYWKPIHNHSCKLKVPNIIEESL